jgi:hypothetical protein
MLTTIRSALRRLDGLVWRIRTRWRHRASLRARAAALAELHAARKAHKPSRAAMRKAHEILRQEVSR